MSAHGTKRTFLTGSARPQLGVKQTFPNNDFMSTRPNLKVASDMENIAWHIFT